VLLGYAFIKAASKNVDEIDPRWNSVSNDELTRQGGGEEVSRSRNAMPAVPNLKFSALPKGKL